VKIITVLVIIGKTYIEENWGGGLWTAKGSTQNLGSDKKNWAVV